MLLPEEERGVFLRQHQNLMLPANHNESTSNAETGNDVGGGEQAFPKDATEQPVAKNDLQPMESPEFGPLGRGLTDGLGGLFEAASTGFSLALESSIIGLKQQNPDMSDEEIMRELLPDVDLEFGEGGVAVPVGIRLRKFPEFVFLYSQRLPHTDSRVSERNRYGRQRKRQPVAANPSIPL